MAGALIAAAAACWILTMIYACGPFRRWRRWWAVCLGVLFASGASLLAWRDWGRAQVREQARRHYVTGIGARAAGDLSRAEQELEKALTLEPGRPDARQALDEVRQQRPAEKRVQEKSTAIESVAGPTPAGGNGPQADVPPSRGTPGSKPPRLAHRESPFEITHYGLDVEIQPAAHRLSATARIAVRSRGSAVPTLEFSLNPECKVREVRLDDAPVSFEQSNDLLAVRPTRPLDAGATRVVTVRYARVGEEKLGGGVGLISESGVYFLSESRWYPATGELDFRAPVRIRARVPTGWTVASIGTLREKRAEISSRGEKSAVFVWETSQPAAMVSLAAGKYQVLRATAQLPGGQVPLQCYTYPEHADRARSFLREAAGILRFYARRFGPYPYEKLALVEIPLFPGGYGSTSFVMLIDASFAAKRLDREFVAHEIAHQWWGNSVFPQGYGAAWLSEAFANYSAWMYDAARAGNPRLLQKRVAKATQDFFRQTTDRGDQALDQTDVYSHVGARDAIIYEKGAVVLHMLRDQIGDEAFKRTMRSFADRFRHGKAGIAEFRAVAEQASAQELDWFFDQWLGRTGGMELEYRFVTEPESLAGNVAVLTISQKSAPYRARLTVDLDVENTVQRRVIELTGSIQSFRFPVQGKLTTVLIDPANIYLMRPPRWVVDEATSAPTRG